MCTKPATVVVFSVLFLCVGVNSAPAPSPGFLGGYHHHLPSATSYSSRIDIHGPEYVKTYAAAPVIKTVVATPVIKTVLPAVSYHAHDPWYDSYGYGHGYSLGHGYGLDHHGYGLGYGYGLGHHY